jgi:hypothetical protein
MAAEVRARTSKLKHFDITLPEFHTIGQRLALPEPSFG